MTRRAAALLALLLMSPALARAAAPKVRAKTFANGLLWLHKPVSHNKIAAFQLHFPGGASDETAKNAGITALMTSAMFKGTARRTALQIAEHAESVGASIGADAETDSWELSAQVALADFEPAFDVFLDVLFSPSFPADEFEKERRAQLNSLRSRGEEVSNVAWDRLQAALYGDHPYGRPDEGTLESVAALTRDDVAAWHRRRLDPRGAVFVTVGDFDVKKLEKLIHKAFDAWTPPAGEARPAAPLKYPAAPRRVEETQPFEQSVYSVAYPAPGVGREDFTAVKLINAMLGAGMSSPLFMAVREQNSLAYDVHSMFGSRKLGSAFIISAGADAANLGLVQAKIEEVLAKFLAEPVPAQELADAKQLIRGHFVMGHQTNGALASYLAWWQLMGKGYAYDELYLKDIDAVSAEDVKRAAARLLGGPAVTVVVRTGKP